MDCSKTMAILSSTFWPADESVWKEDTALTVLVMTLQILAFYGLRGYSKWAFVGYEAIFIVVFFLLAWLALTFIKHQKR